MATLVDYKFWYVTRDDNRFITECAVRFYSGEESAKLEHDLDGVEKSVTRYRRSKRLQGAELPAKAKKKDASGRDTVVYTPEDFGRISTDGQLRTFLKGEIGKFSGRSPIKEQE